MILRIIIAILLFAGTAKVTNLKRLFVALLILALIPTGAMGLTAIPNFTNWAAGYGVDQDNTWDGILVVTDLLSNGGAGSVESISGSVDYKAGSFEELIDYHNANAGVRIMLFEVGGTIECNDRVNITRGGLWIVGQSAPSPGITLKNTLLDVNEGADNVIIQHIRIRTGDEPGWDPEVMIEVTPGVWSTTRDAISISARNVHVDHVSVSWGCDENGGVGLSAAAYASSPNANVTISNSIWSEPLDYPTGYIDPGGENGRSRNGNVGPGDYIAIVDTILAHSKDRNFLVGNGNNNLVFVNNLLYDIKDFALNIQQYGNDNPIEVVSVGNYSLNKEASTYSAATYFATFWDGLTANDYEFDSADGDSFYFEANSNMIGTAAATVQANSDDWTHIRERSAFANIAALKAAVTSDSQLPWPDGYTERTAAAAYTYNIANAGARPFDRDDVDTRIIDDILNLTGRTLVNHPSDVGSGWPDCPVDGEGVPQCYTSAVLTAGHSTDWDDDITTSSAGLFYNISTKIEGMNNFPQNWTTVISGGAYDGYTEGEKWIDEMADYFESGTLAGDTSNKFLDDPNCLHAYFDGSTVIEDSQLNNDLNAGASESEWVNVSTFDNAVYISSTATREYNCQAIADAGGIDLKKIRIFPWNIGDISAKTLYVYKNTQTSGPGSALSGTPGTLIGSVAGTNNWDATAIDIDVTDTSFAQNELLCYSMQGVDSTNYIKMRAVTDADAKLGDVQRFNESGAYTDSPDLDIKTILYEAAGTPPAYANSIATFNGSTQYLYQALTSLHANLVGRTGKTNGSFVIQDISFPSFPTDGNEWTLIYLPDGYVMVVKTVGTDNLLEMRVYDGSDWDAYAITTEDLDPDTLYDILFSIDDIGNLLVIDVATSANSTRIEARIETAFADTPNAPNTGNVIIGYDGSGEFFTGTWGTLVIFDDKPTATEFINMVDGDYNEPLPSMTSWTMDGATLDSTDIGTTIYPSSVFSKVVSFSGVGWEIESGRRDMNCRLTGSGDTATPAIACGPIAGGMGIAHVEVKDANMTVTVKLKDELGNDLTDLSIPAITTPIVITAIPYQSDDPALIGGDDFANFAAFTLMAGDYITFIGDDSATIDAAGVTADSRGYNVRFNVTASGVHILQ